MEKVENVFSRIIMDSIEESKMVGEPGMVVPRHILPKLKKAGLEIVRSSNTAHNSDLAKCKIEAEIKRLEENPEGDYVTRISALEWALRIIAER